MDIFLSRLMDRFLFSSYSASSFLLCVFTSCPSSYFPVLFLFLIVRWLFNSVIYLTHTTKWVYGRHIIFYFLRWEKKFLFSQLFFSIQSCWDSHQHVHHPVSEGFAYVNSIPARSEDPTSTRRQIDPCLECFSFRPQLSPPRISLFRNYRRKKDREKERKEESAVRTQGSHLQGIPRDTIEMHIGPESLSTENDEEQGLIPTHVNPLNRPEVCLRLHVDE